VLRKRTLRELTSARLSLRILGCKSLLRLIYQRFFQKSSGGNAGLMEIAKSGDSHITHRTTATAYILTILLGEHPVTSIEQQQEL
jgi:hypothetical protein